MTDTTFNTTFIQKRLDRWRKGDDQAIDELCRKSIDRMDILARKMFRSFQQIRSIADTGDIVQQALLRLIRSLRSTKPESSRAFINLAALHVRRELLDLSRHVRSRPDLNKRDDGGRLDDKLIDEIQADKESIHELERWSAFHEAVESLNVEQREVFSLSFYQGCSHNQIAELLTVSPRTIRRRWRTACIELNQILGSEFPEDAVATNTRDV